MAFSASGVLRRKTALVVVKKERLRYTKSIRICQSIRPKASDTVSCWIRLTYRDLPRDFPARLALFELRISLESLVRYFLRSVRYGFRADSCSPLGFVNGILFTATHYVQPVKTIVPSSNRTLPSGCEVSPHHSTSDTGNLSFTRGSEAKA